MCARAHVCVHVCLHVVRVYMYVCMYIYTHIHRHLHLHLHIYIYIYIYIYMYIYIYTHTYIYIYTRTHICIHIHIHIHMHIYIYTYMNLCNSSNLRVGTCENHNREHRKKMHWTPRPSTQLDFKNFLEPTDSKLFAPPAPRIEAGDNQNMQVCRNDQCGYKVICPQATYDQISWTHLHQRW